jgi:hypothetical protein
MKKHFIIILFLLILYIVLLYKICFIPKELIIPTTIIFGFCITLYISYISYIQWEKNRLENEILKEQLKLLLQYFKILSDNPNQFISLVHKDNKNYISYPINFSIINFKDLENFDKNTYITQVYTIKDFQSNLFNEIDNLIYNPFFPKELFNILIKLDTRKEFIKLDYIKDYYENKITFQENEKIILYLNKNTEKKDFTEKEPLLTPFNNKKLQLKEVLKIYEEFNKELNKWLKKNKINLKLINIHKI